MVGQPDWIYVTGYTNDLVLFRKQMSELRLEAAIAQFERQRASTIPNATPSIPPLCQAA